MEIIMAVALAFSLIGLIGGVFGVLALIEVRALKQSTHKIQWVPMDNPAQPSDNEVVNSDNEKSVDEWEDDLFQDDIDMFMDPPSKGRKKING